MEAMETLTKADLSRHLMERLELGKKDADLLVNTFLESIIESLKTGDGVELRGFGSFRLRDRRARQGRNPRSGESIQVPPKRVTSSGSRGAKISASRRSTRKSRRKRSAPPASSVASSGRIPPAQSSP